MFSVFGGHVATALFYLFALSVQGIVLPKAHTQVFAVVWVGLIHPPSQLSQHVPYNYLGLSSLCV